MGKRTIILGASDNPVRYAYIASERLKNEGHYIYPVGIRNGVIAGVEILDLKSKPKIDDIDTITMYMNEKRQSEWEEYILSLSPKRIIFNPGAENEELTQKAEAQGIEVLNACTLVLLSMGIY